MIGALPSSLERARTLVEPALRDAVARLDPTMSGPIRYHLGWADADGVAVATGGGKGIRSTLAILSAEAAGAPAPVGVPGAVAVELVHNFSLLHDDVIDGDEERRHRRTVWAQFGIGSAVIAGDALVMLALRSLLDNGSPPSTRAAAVLVAATEAMITGQAVDMAFETRAEVTLEECLEMAGGKTGALLGCAASIGAVLADADDGVVDALGAFGRHLGLSFQAIDDLLGIWGHPDVTGKQAWSDLHQQKKSIPVVFALTRGDDTSEELRAVFSSGDLDEHEVARAALLIERCGGRELTESTAHQHLELAIAALDGVSIDDRAQAELVELAGFVTERDF